MKVLALKRIGEDSYGNGKYTLEYQENNTGSENNYIENPVDGYPVYFSYKGFTFDDPIITEALTNYFDKQSNSNDIISFEELKEMFDSHMELRGTNTITQIKRICIEYAIQKLKEIEFE